ncbi:MAG: hypothetical protein KJ063_20885 [Anaerolineae bacterium]|nr:hypothetical protein [Anaerolineae bacterium]
MSKTIMTQLFFIFSAISLAACSIQAIREDELTPAVTTMANMEATASITQTQNPTATVQMRPTVTATPAPALTTTPTTAPIPTTSPTSTPGIIVRMECPTLISNIASSVWPNGSILFNTGRIWEGLLWWAEVEQEGIWAISAGNLEPQLAYQPARYVAVSPDGAILRAGIVSDNGSPELILYNFITQETTRISVSVAWREYSTFPPRWLPDGRIEYYVVIDEWKLGTGETRDVVFLDLATQTFESKTWELNLPEYEFFEYDIERGYPSGFAAVDPTYKRVLYTAGGGRHHEIRLLDLETGEVLWRGSTPSLVDVPPEWSEDGSSVLLLVGEPIPGTSFAWSKLVSMTRDGIEEELPPQPFPGAESYIANISRSPNGRFIFYSLYSYATGGLHGYVVDTLTWEVGDVCDPEHNLFGSLPYDNVEVDWLPEGQLVYRVLVEKEGQPAHSLRVLDIPSWTAQVIFEAEPGHGVNVFGWTPIEEFP